MFGCYLTQNTAWSNVEKALLNIKASVDFYPENIIGLVPEKLKDLIKPAGFFNQKCIYIKNFTEFFIVNKEVDLTRVNLLNIKGIGEETADSILLYAFKRNEFVIDTYTRRIFSYYGIFKKQEKYKNLKKTFEDNIPRKLEIYQEYHALIVEHAKRYFSKKPHGINDPLALLFE